VHPDASRVLIASSSLLWLLLLLLLLLLPPLPLLLPLPPPMLSLAVEVLLLPAPKRFKISDTMGMLPSVQAQCIGYIPTLPSLPSLLLPAAAPSRLLLWTLTPQSGDRSAKKDRNRMSSVRLAAQCDSVCPSGPWWASIVLLLALLAVPTLDLAVSALDMGLTAAAALPSASEAGEAAALVVSRSNSKTLDANARNDSYVPIRMVPTSVW